MGLTPRAVAAAVALCALAPVGTVSAKPSYTATPGSARSDARFTVTYSGSGTWVTRFHAHPPNPDGKDDTNDAHDTSRQSWAIKYRQPLAVPECGQPSDGSAAPCASLPGVSGASGQTTIAGQVNHKHVDGLYRQLDRKVKCRLRRSPSPRRRLDSTITLRRIPESQSIGIRVSSPLATTVILFPQQCPGQGDSIDRILDFYAMPGFSFAPPWGPDRWFASREVVIPEQIFHSSSKIKVPLADTRAGTPPKDCAVNDPPFERCKTGGSWKGTMTLTRRDG
ncbi:MAG: hypothetical protein QOI61_2016 [Actinomycetota bacterium]|jgi:hypothetical protein